MEDIAMIEVHRQQIERWINETIRQLIRDHDLVYVDREDLVQEGWASALTSYPKWDAEGGSSLQSWILQDLKRDLWRYVEAEGKHHDQREAVDWDTVSFDDLIEANEVDSLIDYEEQERMEQKTDVTRLVSILSERELNVVELYYFEDLSEQEIGDLLGVSRSMIQKIHRRALEKMRAAGVSEVE